MWSARQARTPGQEAGGARELTQGRRVDRLLKVEHAAAAAGQAADCAVRLEQQRLAAAQGAAKEARRQGLHRLGARCGRHEPEHLCVAQLLQGRPGRALGGEQRRQALPRLRGRGACRLYLPLAAAAARD
jgi:hypothetical protein